MVILDVQMTESSVVFCVLESANAWEILSVEVNRIRLLLWAFHWARISPLSIPTE